MAYCYLRRSIVCLCSILVALARCDYYVIDCDSSTSSPSCNSKTLGDIAGFNDSTQSTTINITTERLNLNQRVSFKSVESVKIFGTRSLLNCTTADSGLYFQHVDRLLLENMSISNCGFRNFHNVSSTVHIISSGNITIHNVKISHSRGSGLNIVNSGNTNVTNCNFTNNSLAEVQGEDNYGGSGVRLFIAQNASEQVYSFQHCWFTDNAVTGSDYNYIFTTLDGNALTGSGRGGGMRIISSMMASNVTVLLSDCHFERNCAFLGAGLSAQINSVGINNIIKIEDSKFLENTCNETSRQVAGGGGAYFSFEHNSTNPSNHQIFVRNAIFASNNAKLGGGVYFFARRAERNDRNDTIKFENCQWIQNYGHTGSAVDITPNIFNRVQKGYLPVPVFRNCTFINNTIRNSTPDHRESHDGLGTLYSSLLDIQFQDDVIFENNSGSALIVVNGVVDFEDSNATFKGNQGVQGGAILLIGAASMIVGSGHKYNFTNNTASDKGGAIYLYLVDATDFIVSRSCFLRYVNKSNMQYITHTAQWNASMIFSGNRALRVGHSIYATSVIPCQVVVSRVEAGNRVIYKALRNEEIFQRPGVVIKDADLKNHIATEGVDFSLTSNSNSSNTVELIPGHESYLPLIIRDDLRNEVDATLTAYIDEGNITLKPESSCITNEASLKVMGKEGITGELVFQTLGSRKRSFRVDIRLLPCPPGFKLNKEETCECQQNAYLGIASCTMNRAVLSQGFWAGYVKQGSMFATSVCPLDFCNYNSTDHTGNVLLPSDQLELENAICGKEREGVLCGKCRDGFTTYYHSPNLKCGDQTQVFSCKLGWLFYILSELIPVTLLFLIIVALNISFTNGAVNGFIFFSQVLDTLIIDASGIISFPKPIQILSEGYRLIYGFFSLDFFTIDSLSFCIWKNASAIQMLFFKYLTVGYSLFLVLLVILFMRCCAVRCLGRYYSITSVRNSVIHGLSAFLVLCYSQCIKVSFGILKNQELQIHIDIQTVTREEARSLTRVWFSGNMVFLDREHLPYAVPAFLILLTIGVIPPLVLISYPLLNKVCTCLSLEKSLIMRCFNWASRIKPLLDSFQGCFKDKFRYFSGLYFFYRWITVVTYAAVPFLSFFYTINTILLVAVLVVHSIYQPYQNHWHNVLDTLLFGNLIIINSITFINYYLTRVDGGNRDLVTNSTGAIQVVLIYLPLIYIAVYAVTCILGKACRKGVERLPQNEEFVLTKIGKRIYRSSIGSDMESSTERSLPYRLISKEDDCPFQETLPEASSDTY